ncbi:CARDB domain-containing protein [Pontibacter sp. JAM-7]|uniref:COG1470 family protein n=1 Tax=Pontibacter sp. JAM-7 TaxID=3366581 RepID=UPI003AF72E42
MSLLNKHAIAAYIKRCGLGFAGAVLALMWSMTAYADLQDYAGTATVPGGITPMVHEGNLTCLDLYGDVPGLLEVKLSPDQYLNNDWVTIVLGSNNTFSWSNFQGTIHGIFVKGGPIGGNLYDYDGSGINADGNLHSPVNPQNGKNSGLSHISFCYFPGDPDIDVVKDCPAAPVLVNGGADGATYNYEVTVTNTGDGILSNFQVNESIAGCNISNVPVSLAEGASAVINVACTVPSPLPASGYNEVTVSADTEFAHEPSVSDDGNTTCPDFAPPSIDIVKSCGDPMIRLVEVPHDGGTILGVEACVDITVTNTGADETLTNVMLTDTVALDSPMPLPNLLAGESYPLSLCYFPAAPTGDTMMWDPGTHSVYTVLADLLDTPEALFSNTAGVTAQGVFSGTGVFASDDADCSICYSSTPGLPSACPHPDDNPYLLPLP